MRQEWRERFHRNRLQRKPLASDPSVHHGTHVGIANPRWQVKRSRHARRICNPQFYQSGKRPKDITCGNGIPSKGSRISSVQLACGLVMYSVCQKPHPNHPFVTKTQLGGIDISKIYLVTLKLLCLVTPLELECRAVRCRYGTVNLLPIPHNRCLIGRPWGEFNGFVCTKFY